MSSARIRCAWCSHLRLVPVSHGHNSRPPRYCSSHCANRGRAAYKARYWASVHAADAQDDPDAVIEARYRAALRAIRLLRHLTDAETLAQRR